jgi:uncharacterized protein (TIGR03067 family)
MRLASTLLVLSAMAFFGADDTKKSDADLLKGKWSVVAISTAKEDAPEDVFKDLRMSFEDKTYTVTGNAAFEEEGEYTIDASKTPKTIDFDIKKGQEAGKHQLGIYKIEDKKLTIIVAEAGEKERPTSFTLKEGSAHAKVVLEKK